MEKLRAAIIGSGGISACHLRGYRKLPNVEVVACCDINEQTAKAYAEKNNILQLQTAKHIFENKNKKYFSAYAKIY